MTQYTDEQIRGINGKVATLNALLGKRAELKSALEYADRFGISYLYSRDPGFYFPVDPIIPSNPSAKKMLKQMVEDEIDKIDSELKELGCEALP